MSQHKFSWCGTCDWITAFCDILLASELYSKESQHRVFVFFFHYHISYFMKYYKRDFWFLNQVCSSSSTYQSIYKCMHVKVIGYYSSLILKYCSLKISNNIGLLNWYWRILALVGFKMHSQACAFLKPTRSNIHQYQFSNSFV